MLTGLIFSAALSASTSAQPAWNDLSSIPLAEQSVARCMLSAVKSNKRVGNARLQVVLTLTDSADAGSTKQVFVEYAYAQTIPELKRQAHTTRYDITPFLAPSKGGNIPVILFEGIMPKPAPPGYFRDSHYGMMEINVLWEKNCLAQIRAAGK